MSFSSDFERTLDLETRINLLWGSSMSLEWLSLFALASLNSDFLKTSKAELIF